MFFAKINYFPPKSFVVFVTIEHRHDAWALISKTEVIATKERGHKKACFYDFKNTTYFRLAYRHIVLYNFLTMYDSKKKSKNCTKELWYVWSVYMDWWDERYT